MGARGSPNNRLYSTDTYAEPWEYSGQSFGEV